MENVPLPDTTPEAATPAVPEAVTIPFPTHAAENEDAPETETAEMMPEVSSAPIAIPSPVPGPALKVHDDCLLESVGFQFDNDFFFVMLHAGASLTTFGGRIFSTTADWQTELDIPVYAGTNSFASRNRPLGTCIISGLPAGPRGKARVEIRFTACEDGTLSITALAKDSGRDLAVELREVES